VTATLTFNDDFNSLNLWNGTSGTWSTTTAYVDPNGNGSSLPSNGEQEWYINNLFAPTSSVKPWTVSNGILTLTAQQTDPSIAQHLGYNQAGLPAMGSYQYTSGLVETNHSFTQTYGYFEMRAQLPSGQGTWPAFWLMPADGSWPPELDVMEVVNDPTKLYTSIHTAQTGTHTSSGLMTVTPDMSAGYHTFGVDWEADKVTYYFDGKAVYQVDTPADMHKPMYMIANLAMGGGWPGNVDASTPLPAHMNIDYIRAYSSLPTDVIATEAAGGTPTVDGSTLPAAGGSTPSTSGVPVSPGAQQVLTTNAWSTTLDGSAGEESIQGQGGDDFIRAMAGNDTVDGGGGADVLNGNQGNDLVHGGDGNDIVMGGQGDDTVYGDAGANTLSGNRGADQLFAGNQGDVVYGGQGDDTIHGGDGADTISGDLGNDILFGGGGADHFVFDRGAGTDWIAGFNSAEGDRVVLPNWVHFTVADDASGQAIITLDSGDHIGIVGTSTAQLGDWLIQS
jgi:beta-glucanase (GH16 family)